MKEKDMQVPNYLGHYYRDIISVENIDAWHTKVTMSCGHQKAMSRKCYDKYGGHATLCLDCEKPKETKMISEENPRPAIWITPNSDYKDRDYEISEALYKFQECLITYEELIKVLSLVVNQEFERLGL